jgi:hypothetical protein
MNAPHPSGYMALGIDAERKWAKAKIKIDKSEFIAAHGAAPGVDDMAPAECGGDDNATTWIYLSPSREAVLRLRGPYWTTVELAERWARRHHWCEIILAAKAP